jgi:dolichol-phosphate mannosyltransferase
MLPTLNEEEALQALAPELPKDFDVLVVDGGSMDRTEEVSKKLGYKFIAQKYGRGKGCGVRTGMEYFLSNDHDYLAIIDTDYTNDPSELPGMLERLMGNGFDIILGDRDRKKQLELLGWFSLFINTSTSGLTSFAYKTHLPDIQTGYWIFSRKAVQILLPLLVAKGFEIEYDIVYNSWKEGLKIGVKPVTFRERVGTSKFTNYLRFKQIYYGLTYVNKSLYLMLLNAFKGTNNR